jgi:hypothetical protein
MKRSPFSFRVRLGVLMAVFLAVAGLYLRGLAKPLVTVEDPNDNVRIEDLSDAFAAKIVADAQELDGLIQEAGKALDLYLQSEIEEDYQTAYGLLSADVHHSLGQDLINRAIISDIRLFQNQDTNPTPQYQDTLDRVENMIKAGKLSLDVDDPPLWAYQWTHSTGSCEARFESTGPYANQFRLLSYQLARIAMAPQRRDLAMAWIAEDIRMPTNIQVSRVSEYLIRLENGEWKIWGHRGVAGPMLTHWLDLRTSLWPDELALKYGTARDLQELTK